MADATAARPVGTRKQLLFDRRFVESSEGLQFTVNPPLQRTPVNLPSLCGLHHSGGLTVLDVDGRLWLYYLMTPNETREPDVLAQMYCLAYSDDGIDWELAQVDRFEVAGLARNNVVMPGAAGNGVPRPPGDVRLPILVRGIPGRAHRAADLGRGPGRVLRLLRQPPSSPWRGLSAPLRGRHIVAPAAKRRRGSLPLRHAEPGPLRCRRRRLRRISARRGGRGYVGGPGWGRRRTVARLTSPELTQLPFDFREDTTLPRSPVGL